MQLCAGQTDFRGNLQPPEQDGNPGRGSQLPKARFRGWLCPVEVVQYWDLNRSPSAHIRFAVWGREGAIWAGVQLSSTSLGTQLRGEAARGKRGVAYRKSRLKIKGEVSAQSPKRQAGAGAEARPARCVYLALRGLLEVGEAPRGATLPRSAAPTSLPRSSPRRLHRLRRLPRGPGSARDKSDKSEDKSNGVGPPPACVLGGRWAASAWMGSAAPTT